MPHQCTNCKRTFPDGSKEMLSGCPDCGGNKFQFKPAEASDDSSDRHSALGPSDRHSEVGPSDRHSEVGPPKRTTDDNRPDDNTDSNSGFQFGAEPSSSSQNAEAKSSRSVESPTDTQERSTDGPEDRAQASARTDVVDTDELPATANPTTSRANERPSSSGQSSPDAEEHSSDEQPKASDHDRPDSSSDPPSPDQEPSSDQKPGIDDLRQELNDQFESIRIVSPGEYELNLMELYDRKEYIISLQEDGRYVIEVPDRWSDDND